VKSKDVTMVVIQGDHGDALENLSGSLGSVNYGGLLMLM
jgi:hypothetical protein